MSTMQTAETLAALAVPAPVSAKPNDRLHVRLAANRTAELETALKAVQSGRGQNHLTVGELLALAKRAEAALETLDLPKSARRGAKFAYAMPGASANSYRHSIPTTEAVLRRDARGWLLADLYSIRQFPKAPTIKDVTLTAEQAAKLAGHLQGHRRFRMKFSGPFKLS